MRLERRALFDMLYSSNELDTITPQALVTERGGLGRSAQHVGTDGVDLLHGNSKALRKLLRVAVENPPTRTGSE